jgi:hypothetical protein
MPGDSSVPGHLTCRPPSAYHPPCSRRSLPAVRRPERIRRVPRKRALGGHLRVFGGHRLRTGAMQGCVGVERAARELSEVAQELCDAAHEQERRVQPPPLLVPPDRYRSPSPDEGSIPAFDGGTLPPSLGVLPGCLEASSSRPAETSRRAAEPSSRPAVPSSRPAVTGEDPRRGFPLEREARPSTTSSPHHTTHRRSNSLPSLSLRPPGSLDMTEEAVSLAYLGLVRRWLAPYAAST